MSETFNVSATERGVIRLFTVNLSADQIAAFTGSDIDEGALAPINAALGVTYLDSDFVELFPVSNLSGLGLAGYMVEGLGIAESDIAPQRMRLNSLSGHVLIVLSSAFGGFETTIRPSAPLKWIGTYTEEGADIKFAPLPSKAAKGTQDGAPAKPPKSDARVGGMIAMYALIFMFVLVGLIIWISG